MSNKNFFSAAEPPERSQRNHWSDGKVIILNFRVKKKVLADYSRVSCLKRGCRSHFFKKSGSIIPKKKNGISLRCRGGARPSAVFARGRERARARSARACRVDGAVGIIGVRSRCNRRHRRGWAAFQLADSRCLLRLHDSIPLGSWRRERGTGSAERVFWKWGHWGTGVPFAGATGATGSAALVSLRWLRCVGSAPPSEWAGRCMSRWPRPDGLTPSGTTSGGSPPRPQMWWKRGRGSGRL